MISSKVSLRFDHMLLKHIEKQDNVKAQLILEQADDPYNVVDSFENTLLHYAAKYKNIDRTKYLIESRSSIDAQNEDGKTPLIVAMEQRDSTDIAEVLIDANADINICDKSGNSPLHLANNRFINYELWRKFLKKLEIQFSYNYKEITNLLTSVGCNLVDAMYVGCAEVTRMLLKRGSRPDEYTYSDHSPLHLAVAFMHLENGKILLEHGANVNVLTPSGVTPAFFIDATHKNANLVLEISKALLDRGAQMYVSGRESYGVMQMRNLLYGGTKDVIGLLMKYNFDWIMHDENGSTAMHALAYNKNPGVFAELRDKSFGVDARDRNNITPLWMAVCNPSSVKFLLDHADVNAGSDYGITALMKPFVRVRDDRARLESIELLLQYGANFETVNLEGMTIFDAAVKYEGAVRLFLQ